MSKDKRFNYNLHGTKKQKFATRTWEISRPTESANVMSPIAFKTASDYVGLDFAGITRTIESDVSRQRLEDSRNEDRLSHTDSAS